MHCALPVFSERLPRAMFCKPNKYVKQVCETKCRSGQIVLSVSFVEVLLNPSAYAFGVCRHLLILLLILCASFWFLLHGCNFCLWQKNPSSFIPFKHIKIVGGGEKRWGWLTSVPAPFSLPLWQHYILHILSKINCSV